MKKSIGHGSGNITGAVILYGALWGLCEAVFGFLLHLLSRFTGVSSLAGFFMFPLGLWFMMGGIQSTGRTGAALMIATIAAAIKVSSSVIGPVPWIFVQNPTFSILLEGLVVWVMARFLIGNRSPSVILSSAVGAAISWRLLFVLVHVVLGIQWGLLSRGMPAVARFMLLDSAVNGLLIFAILRFRLPEKLKLKIRVLHAPAFAASLLVLAAVTEMVFSSL